MAARRDAKILHDVVEVRRIQRRAAEMEVAGVDAALHRFDTQRRVTLAVLSDEQAMWGEAVSRTRFDLQLVGAWSAAVAITEAGLRTLDSQIEESRQDRERKVAAWRGALAQANAAEDLAKAARRRDLHRREETALGEIADRAAQGGRVDEG